MKNLIIVISVIMTTMVGCKSKDGRKLSKTEIEIIELQTKQNKKDYLLKINEIWKKGTGKKNTEMFTKYGRNSKEFKEFMELKAKRQEENLEKIEIYLKVHGYPKVSEVGKKAANVPLTIVKWSRNYESRERNFKILYEAYLKGDIGRREFSNFLYRMYQMKKGEVHNIKGYYKDEGYIERLIQSLDLDTLNTN